RRSPKRPSKRLNGPSFATSRRHHGCPLHASKEEEPMMRRLTLAMFLWAMAGHAFAQDQRAGQVVGRIVDETGGVLPGVLVELRGGTGAPATAVSSEIGEYAFDAVTPGSYHLSFSMMNFSEARRDVHVAGTTRVDIVLHLSLTA